MQPDEATGLHYLVPSGSLSSPYPPHFGMMSTTTQSNPASAFQFNRFSATPLYNNYQFPSHLVPQEVNNNNNPQQPCSFSSNSTSDEADEQQLSLINERKQRRMISNRESARRSRMRKQKHLDELWSQVVWLRNENHQLVDKLNHVSESHDRVLQENAQLKEEASELRQMLSDLQLHSPNSNYHPSLRDQLEVDVPCNTAYLRAESSNQPITTSSMDLLG
ncbi:putative transcription factor bZIP family [Rosa chinensis]|uniref:Putative transcription factor bZIP family n=1 Tax=Rosa chinensis TaxID=74649 RepID=A0A2P6S3I8_ROSCH|nr:basic leucine zipper 43 [Rosa chinensis]PRQ53232.1 putative transcription factor bZIP family [Rosa chinensis]